MGHVEGSFVTVQNFVRANERVGVLTGGGQPAINTANRMLLSSSIHYMYSSSSMSSKGQCAET